MKKLVLLSRKVQVPPLLCQCYKWSMEQFTFEAPVLERVGLSAL